MVQHKIFFIGLLKILHQILSALCKVTTLYLAANSQTENMKKHGEHVFVAGKCSIWLVNFAKPGK